MKIFLKSISRLIRGISTAFLCYAIYELIRDSDFTKEYINLVGIILISIHIVPMLMLTFKNYRHILFQRIITITDVFANSIWISLIVFGTILQFSENATSKDPTELVEIILVVLTVFSFLGIDSFLRIAPRQKKTINIDDFGVKQH